jgi:hypothetical protein
LVWYRNFPAQKQKTRIVDAGFLIARLVTFRLVADPHRPRTIIRTRIIAAVRINQGIGGKTEHGANLTGLPGCWQVFFSRACQPVDRQFSFPCNLSGALPDSAELRSGGDQQTLQQRQV